MFVFIHLRACISKASIFIKRLRYRVTPLSCFFFFFFFLLFYENALAFVNLWVYETPDSFENVQSAIVLTCPFYLYIICYFKVLRCKNKTDTHYIVSE